MELTCEACGKTLKIPDEKVPKGKAFSITCPSCKGKISVEPSSGKTPPATPAPAPPHPAAPEPVPDSSDGGGGGENGALSAPPGALEFLDEGARTAIICEHDPKLRELFKTSAENLGFVTVESASPRDALKQMRYHDFNLVVLNELFGTREPEMNQVLKYLSQLGMVNRRAIFVALITERFRTGDRMQAYNKGVNSIFNVEDAARYEKLLDQAIKENIAFFRVYRDEYKKIKGI